MGNSKLTRSNTLFRDYGDLISKIMREVFSVLEVDHYRALLDSSRSIGHGFEHLFKVLDQALNIAKATAKKQNLDTEVIVAASLLHDITYVAEKQNIEFTGIERAVSDGKSGHNIDSAELVREQLLPRIGWEKDKINATAHCIEAHRGKEHGIFAQTIEAKIVSDADTLESTLNVDNLINIVNQLRKKIVFFDEAITIEERLRALKGETITKKKDMLQRRLKNLIFCRFPSCYYTSYAQKLASDKFSKEEIKSDLRRIVESRKDLGHKTKERIYKVAEEVLDYFFKT